MSKIKKEIDCLNRLNALTGQSQDILDFLRSEDLITDGQHKAVRQSSDRAKEIQAMLSDLQVRQKIQMLMYMWSILPVENITVTIITDRNQKEFSFTG
jgi:hypothetical protein